MVLVITVTIITVMNIVAVERRKSIVPKRLKRRRTLIVETQTKKKKQ